LGVASRQDGGGRTLLFKPPKAFAPTDLGLLDPYPTGHLAPSPDGRFAYSARGVFDRNGRFAMRPDGDYFYTLPTAQGSDLFLSVGVDDRGKFEPPLHLHLAGQRTAVAALAGISLPTGLDPTDSSEVPMDQRIHLWPAAGLLAVLPTSNAAIEMYKVDVPGLLQKSGKDYLVFGSEPPTSVTRGEVLTYKPTVWAHPAGVVTFDVSGVQGWRVKDGQLLWPVPAAGDQREAALKLIARHPDGRTAEQSIRVLLLDPPPTP
jgi:hypothetical protein